MNVTVYHIQLYHKSISTFNGRFTVVTDYLYGDNVVLMDEARAENVNKCAPRNIVLVHGELSFILSNRILFSN